MESDKIEIGPYIVDKKVRLGGGNFGTVFQAVHKDTNDIVAAKQIKITNNHIKEYAEKEIRTIEAVTGHGNILSFVWKLTDVDSEFWIMTEMCNLGNLSEYVCKYTLNIGHILNIIRQCCSAFTYLHTRDPQVIHRDIKPENVLLTLENGRHVVKICDFGVAKMFELEDIKKFFSTVAGTRPFMAPEILVTYLADGRPQYDAAVDVFAAGLVFLLLLRAKIVVGFEKDDILTGKPTALKMKSNPGWTPVEIVESDSLRVGKTKEIISQMVRYKAKDRLQMSEVEGKIEDLCEPNEALPVEYGHDEEDPLLGDPRPGFWQKYPSCKWLIPIGLILLALGVAAGIAPFASESDIVNPPEVGDVNIRNLTMKSLDFTANDFIAMDETHVLLEKINATEWVYLTINVVDHRNISYSEDWRRNRPAFLWSVHFKCILPNSSIFVRDAFIQEGRLTTYELSENLKSVNNFTGDYGNLRGALLSNILAYAEDLGSDYQISLYESHRHNILMNLTSKFLYLDASVGAHYSGWMAVLVQRYLALTIFRPDGVYNETHKLSFYPSSRNSLAAVNNVIIMISISPKGLYIYSWSGVELKFLNNAELGVDPEDDIVGVSKALGNRFHIAVGELATSVKAIYLYQIDEVK